VGVSVPRLAFHVIRPEDRRPRPPRYRGSRGETIGDAATPTVQLSAGQVALEPGTVVPMHYHTVETLEHVVSGQAIIVDRHGNAVQVGPGCTCIFPPRPEAAHRWTVTGNLPLLIFFVYPRPPGSDDQVTWLEGPSPPFT